MSLFVVRLSSVLAFILATSTYATPNKIALIQYDADSHFGDHSANTANLTSLSLEAIADGAKALVFPEGSTFGYAEPTRVWCKPGLARFQNRDCEDVSQVAERVPEGKTSKYWIDFAKDHDVTVLFSVIETDGNRFFNTLVAVDEAGLVGRYRKTYLYWIDEAYASPGDQLFVVKLFGESFGLMICMDANYADLYRAYKAQGISKIIVSMDWDQDPESNRAGRAVFRQLAKRQGMNLFVSDQAAWDSTGFYPASGEERRRAPMPSIARNKDGFVLVDVGL